VQALNRCLGLRRHRCRKLWERAWQPRTNLSAYDALYVALAKQLKVALLTSGRSTLSTPGAAIR
jgi:predicted nucleic acid-binding protein